MDMAIVAMIVLIVIGLLDCILYTIAIIKYGPCYNYWPLSGFYELVNYPCLKA